MMCASLRELRRANLAAVVVAERPARTGPVRRWLDLFRARHADLFGNARWTW
jgi:hypothetical protein